MVTMLETFIVYHLFQICQGLLCGNLMSTEISLKQEKYFPARRAGWRIMAEA
jgi:hypothetical protein